MTKCCSLKKSVLERPALMRLQVTIANGNTGGILNDKSGGGDFVAFSIARFTLANIS